MLRKPPSQLGHTFLRLEENEILLMDTQELDEVEGTSFYII